MSDYPSPRQFRVDGVVPNIDAWYLAFDVKPGDKMCIPSRQEGCDSVAPARSMVKPHIHS